MTRPSDYLHLCRRTLRAVWIYLHDGDEQAFDQRLNPQPLVRMGAELRYAAGLIGAALMPVVAKSVKDAAEFQALLARIQARAATTHPPKGTK